jgi:catechol 2,3-dioxygenase-like lactoylglutathione lyase family enzyme
VRRNAALAELHASPQRRRSAKFLERVILAALLGIAAASELAAFAQPAPEPSSPSKKIFSSDLPSAPASQAQGALVSAVVSVGMTVSDLDRSVDWYTRVLGFAKVSEMEASGPEVERLYGVFGARVRVAALRLGEETFELTEFLVPRGRPVPADARSNDRSFQHVAIVVSDMKRAYSKLREAGAVHASTAPQKLPAWNPNAGGIEAFYFRDPDGHALEVIFFPEGKGDPKWRRSRAGNPLFLGIDHTAIVVSNTDASLGFYTAALGLRVAGTSENWGDEQEHLNDVFGARLRITGLRAASGPGIEFLEYLVPGDGRPYPQDSRANDLWHWQTRLAVANAAAAEKSLFSARVRFVSTGARTLPDSRLGFTRVLLVRDPDGHALELTEN